MKKILTGTLFFFLIGVVFAFESNVIQASARIDKPALLGLVEKHDPALLQHAERILDRVYEAERRQVGRGSDGGQAFPMNPEIMHILMSDCQGKTVLEIGAASGENSLLLGLAGAQHVYVNDIQKTEIDAFKLSVGKLPKKIRPKFTAIREDCFKLGQVLEANSIDILLVRNFFHFVPESKQNKFFDLVKSLLKPGGSIIISVSNGHGGNRSIHQQYPDKVCFEVETLLLDNVNESPIGISQFFVRPCKPDLDSLLFSYNTHTVAYVEPAGYIDKYIYGYANSEYIKTKKYDEMSEQSKDALNKFMQRNENEYRNNWPSNMKIRLLCNNFMSFSIETLSNLLVKHGFEIGLATYIDDSGHSFQVGDGGGKDINDGVSINIIATLPVAQYGKSGGDEL